MRMYPHTFYKLNFGQSRYQIWSPHYRKSVRMYIRISKKENDKKKNAENVGYSLRKETGEKQS